MPNLLRLRWERDPDGYHVQGIRLVAVGDRVLIYKPLDEYPALFREFADLKCSPASIKAFANKYGLLTNDEAGAQRSTWYERIKRMRESVALWKKGKKTGDLSEFIEMFNKGPRGISSIGLVPTVDPERPDLHIVPRDLLAGMWLQFGQAVSANMQLKKCLQCPTWFAYGTGTGRRKSGLYCSDRCRKAAHREQRS